MFDVAVIGAGVVGGLVARELTRNGLSAVMLEQANDVGMGATRANSAIVHAGFDAKEGSLKAALNLRGSEMMEKLCLELGVKYKRNGSLVVGFNDEDKNTLSGLLERGRKNGVKDLALIGREEILALEPSVGNGVKWALHAPTGAIICPYELCMAAVGNAIDNGARLLCGFKVEKIEKVGGVFNISSSDSTVSASCVINCAGVCSDEIAAMVGDTSFTVRPRRGEYMLLDKECGDLIGHTVFRCPSKMGKGILVSPTVDGNLILGPTAEDIDEKDDVSTTSAALARIRASAEEQVKGISYAKVITSFAGLRSVGSTGDFIINSPVDGFVNVAAIESPGLSSAPAIAEYVCEMLAQMGVKMAPRVDFNGTRRSMHWFSELTAEKKNEIIREMPEYAHVVCRCERVTEGEILYALRTEPKPRDLDGVKRRTRASMGRCQGGFCTPYIIELLAKELNCDYCEVTKFGGDSVINLGRTKENTDYSGKE